MNFNWHDEVLRIKSWLYVTFDIKKWQINFKWLYDSKILNAEIKYMVLNKGLKNAVLIIK